MKNSFFLSLLIFSLFFTSCNENRIALNLANDIVNCSVEDLDSLLEKNRPVTDFYLDSVLVNKPSQYFKSSKDFKDAREIDVPFMANDVDKQILKDTSNYRVYDIQGRLQAKISYFHKSVGGYSAVRPRRMDELFTYSVENNLNEIGASIDSTLNITKSNAVLNLLNVKYLVVPTGKGELAVQNPFANGNAWFVEEVITVKSADEEMKSLDNLDSKNANPDITKPLFIFSLTFINHHLFYHFLTKLSPCW